MNQITSKIDSKTLWQSLIATALWVGASAAGVPIPYEVLLGIILAIGGKEAAGKIADAKVEAAMVEGRKRRPTAGRTN